MAWCKLHTDILGDAKLLRATRKGARSLVVLPWLIAWAKAHDPEDTGRLLLDGEPVEPEDVAMQLPGVKASEVAACMAALEQIGVLVPDGTALRFAAWPTRSGTQSQKPSDHPDAVRDRVQRHRARQRQTPAPPTPTPQVTAPHMDSSEAVTPPRDTPAVSRGVTRGRNAVKRVTGVSSVTQNKSKSESESESKTESENNYGPAADASGGAYRGLDVPRDPTPVQRAFTMWQARIGETPFPRFAKAFGPVFKPSGERPPYEAALVERAIDRWAARVRGTRDAEFVSPERFVGRIVEHVRVAQMPVEQYATLLPLPARSNGQHAGAV